MYTKISIAGIDRIDWLKLRKTGIGGSDAAAVCGLNPYSSAMNVYISKVNAEIKDEDNESMRQGRDLEDYVAQRFTEETGIKVRKTNFMYRSKQWPFMIADIDRQLVGIDAGLECKTANAYNADQWEGDKVPIHYFIQCQHYMAVTGKESWYIAVLILGVGFKYRKIERDEDLIKNLIFLEEKFWKDHVLAGHMPEPDGSESCDELLAQYYKNSKKDSRIPLIGFNEELKRRKELVDLIKKMETELDTIDQSLKMFLGENEIAENDNFRVSWKQVDSQKFDQKALKDDMPDIYEKYTKLSSYRRFTVKAA